MREYCLSPTTLVHISEYHHLGNAEQRSDKRTIALAWRSAGESMQKKQPEILMGIADLMRSREYVTGNVALRERESVLFALVTGAMLEKPYASKAF